MKKTTFIRILKILSLAIPVLLFVLFSQQYLFYYANHSSQRIRSFYQEEKDSLDVVFLGASEVFSGFAPGLAYEEFGFTSYMYAIDANSGELYKYQLEEVLKHQNPQLIFVEVNGFLYDTADENHVLNIFADNIPMSLNKMKAVWNLKDEDKLSSLIPFIAYHGNWTEGEALLEQVKWRINTSRTPSLLKGMVTTSEIDKQLLDEIEHSEKQLSELQFTEDILDDFLLYCQEKNLDNIVFIRFPHKNADLHKIYVDQLGKYLQTRGYPFLNLEEHKDEMGIEILQDYYNPEHLNIYGQKKLTTYLGNMITNDFHMVPATQSENNRLLWKKCVDYYHSFYAYTHENIINGTLVSPSEQNPSYTLFLDWMNQHPEK